MRVVQIAVRLLLDPAKVVKLDKIPYWHQTLVVV